MDEAESGRRREALVIVAALLAVVVPSQILWATTQNFVLALAPVLAVAGVACLRYAPTRWLALGLLVMFVTLDSIDDRPFNLEWSAPTVPLSRALFANIKLVAPIDLIIPMVFVTILVRRTSALFVPLRRLLWLFLATMVWMGLWGIVRGGDLRMAWYQVRVLVWIPALVSIFFYALNVKRDLRTIAGILLFGATFKALLAIYFRYVYCAATGSEAPTATTHSDTVLFVSALTLLIALTLELKSRLRLALPVALVPVIVWGLVANNRRLAYASLAFSVVATYSVLRDPIRRWANRAIAFAMPMAFPYLLIGWNRTGGIWGPAATIASMAQGHGRDASTATRDIENYNLVLTWKSNLLLGQGWGHAYYEVSEAYSITQFFENYRYVAHNGVLWLASNAGIVGLTGLWMAYAGTAFFAARASRRLPHGLERAFALWSFSIVPIALVQAYGDMGFQCWHAVVQLSLATAIVAQSVEHDENRTLASVRNSDR
ncbi:MAG: O-antigen ligase family protein [Polyangiaceae bacterium]|jgi:hypothetical protein|nr:O-antigen ligase family protein [Polyangiaceae bacterium]